MLLLLVASASAAPFTSYASYSIDFDAVFTGIGDVNGDGYDDAAWNDPSGAVQIHMGGPGGLDSAVAATLTETTGMSYPQVRIDAAGDVNGDGYDDVVVAYGAAAWSHGRAWFYHGSASGLSTTPSTSVSGMARSTLLGLEAHRAGDFNGDGYDDVAFAISPSAAVVVYFGSAAGVRGTSTRPIVLPLRTSWVDQTIDAAGDVDGDGYEDLVVGAFNGDGDDGGVYIVYGQRSTFSSPRTTEVHHPVPGSSHGTSWSCIGNAWLGYSVVGAGDVDGDGYADVLAGAPDDLCWGMGYVFYGGPGGLVTTSWSELGGYVAATATFNLGWSAAAGDYNGDGYGDIALGGDWGGYALGGPGGLVRATAASPALIVPSAIGGLGGPPVYSADVHRIGDVNGDGRDDIAVKVYQGSWDLRVYVGAP